MSSPDPFQPFEAKMRKAGAKESAIRSFELNHRALIQGENGSISEESIEPVGDLPRWDSIASGEGDADLRSQVAILKLNGGLGTGMGLQRPKSLLPLRDGVTFLDLIARQILFLRQQAKSPLPFVLMNSVATSRETRHFLERYPDLGTPEELEMLQNAAPKIDAATFLPAEWPSDPALEWAPLGHGDLYPSLAHSGWLDRLIGGGVTYLFVSNADNLGATLDLPLLTYFARSDLSFLMEVAERTAADSKGGHLARRRDGGLLLREAAQCAAADAAAFQNIERYRYFNTNTIWIRLDRLKSLLDQNGGFLKLPLIQNRKPLDPTQLDSPAILQLETAMGAAIERFDRAGALVVPRGRFAPVKTTADLLAVRSDVYNVTAESRVELAASRNGEPPLCELDPNHYRTVAQFDARFQTIPSLRLCRTLRVRGPIDFGPGIEFEGDVELINSRPAPHALPAGRYANTTIHLPISGRNRG